MTRWRLPTRQEERADFVLLRGFLADEVARAIAAMPIVVPEPEIPLDIRIDAWLWRTRARNPLSPECDKEQAA
jgi:hypothetical protein